ncbi:hypothetical protein HAX54_022419, partial [Datura stramonium]|nr:hypothetical protein [Datura stramonium]
LDGIRKKKTTSEEPRSSVEVTGKVGCTCQNLNPVVGACIAPDESSQNVERTKLSHRNKSRSGAHARCVKNLLIEKLGSDRPYRCVISVSRVACRVLLARECWSNVGAGYFTTPTKGKLDADSCWRILGQLLQSSENTRKEYFVFHTSLVNVQWLQLQQNSGTQMHGKLTDILFGALLLVHLPHLDPFPGYVPLRSESIDDNDDETILGADHIFPERYASILSRISFGWITPLLRRGYNRPITEKDVWKLDSWDKTETLSA